MGVVSTLTLLKMAYNRYFWFLAVSRGTVLFDLFVFARYAIRKDIDSGKEQITEIPIY